MSSDDIFVTIPQIRTGLREYHRRLALLLTSQIQLVEPGSVTLNPDAIISGIQFIRLYLSKFNRVEI